MWSLVTFALLVDDGVSSLSAGSKTMLVKTLTTGYSLAVAALGAVAPEHRTDNLAAAVPIGGHGAFQIKWTDFLQLPPTVPTIFHEGDLDE